MTERIGVKQLTAEAESLRRAGEPGSRPRIGTPVENSPTLANDVLDARFAALADDTLPAAINDDDPYTRLAACWRIMTRDQALGTAAPTDGVRLLLLVNVASVQDLRVLEIVAEIDPCPTVRAAANTFLWRVARDRDRVIELLLARLAVESAPTVLVALLDLTPPLPFALASTSLRAHLEHGALEVRARVMRQWIANDGDDASMVAAIIREPDRELRLAALEQCARSDRFERMPRWIGDSEVMYDALRALAAANRRFPFTSVGHLIDDTHLEDVLVLVGGPYRPEDRERLVELTRVFDPDVRTWIPPQLMRCLSEACLDAPRTAADQLRIARLRAARELVTAELAALGSEGAPMQLRDDDDDWSDDEWDDPAHRLAGEAFALDVLLSVLEP